VAQLKCAIARSPHECSTPVAQLKCAIARSPHECSTPVAQLEYVTAYGLGTTKRGGRASQKEEGI